MKTIKVLIVDDSAVVRQTLKDLLLTDPHIEVIGTAPDAIIAIHKIERKPPDVIILDLEMPRMDGLTFLKKMMERQPIPVIVCSSLTETGSDAAIRAIEYGALEVIQKPRLGTKQFFEESKILFCDSVKAAAQAKLNVPVETVPKYLTDVALRKSMPVNPRKRTEKIVVVGASTGGTDAIRVFLESLPHNAPGAVIVQHMPEHFTTSFARRLNELCDISVKEAANNDPIIAGQALIAPGNQHLLVKRRGQHYFVEVRSGPLVCRHRPSVDVLFRSAARYAGSNAIGVIMTGMGDDGATGMLEMHRSGAYTIAQDEATSVVFGMPNEAIKRGAVNRVLPLGKISAEILRATRQKS